MICHLLFSFLLFGGPSYDLTDLVAKPSSVIGKRYQIVDTRENQRQIEGQEESTRKASNQFTEETLKSGDDGRRITVLRHYEKAWRQHGDTPEALAHQGAFVLFQKRKNRDGPFWQHDCYLWQNDTRREVTGDDLVLKTESAHLDAAHDAYAALMEKAPKGPVPLGSSWPVTIELLAEASDEIKGFKPEKSNMTATLVKVDDTRIHLRIEGTLLMSSAKKDLQFTWKGTITRGELVLQRGPYLELERKLRIEEVVTLSQGEKSASGKGLIKYTRTVTPVPET